MHVDRVTGHRQNGRVERVDGFKPEFHALTLRDSELPREPQIDLLQPRSALGAYTAVPEMTRSRIRHGGGIEPYIPAAGEVLIGGLARGRDTVGTALRGTRATVARPIQQIGRTSCRERVE